MLSTRKAATHNLTLPLQKPKPIKSSTFIHSRSSSPTICRTLVSSQKKPLQLSPCCTYHREELVEDIEMEELAIIEQEMVCRSKSFPENLNTVETKALTRPENPLSKDVLFIKAESCGEELYSSASEH